MTMHDIRTVALNCEAKKHGYRQTQDGVVVSFVLHPQEVPDALAVAPLGTRYILAMVEIGDDEKPKPPAAKETAAEPQPTPNPNVPAGAKRPKSWHEMLPAQQCGILCSEPSFLFFLRQEYPGIIP